MIERDNNTGFYVGRLLNYNNGIWRNDCVPTAIGNYLIVQNTPFNKITNIINSLYTHDAYNASIGGFDLCSTPQIIEDCMREHLDPAIEVRLHLSGATGIPPENDHVKSFDGLRDIPVPCIVLTHYENTREDHFWTATSDDGIITRIDNDGSKHANIKPIAGYISFRNYGTWT